MQSGDESDRDGDREVGNEVLAVARRADRDQHERRVDERRDERAEGDLRAAIPNEVPQHPRPELCRGQRQRHDRDREHHADHGDDRRGEGREDLTRGVGGAEDHPRWKRQAAVERGLIERVRGEVQRHGGDDFDRRDEPEVRPQRLPAPVGTQRNERDHGS